MPLPKNSWNTYLECHRCGASGIYEYDSVDEFGEVIHIVVDPCPTCEGKKILVQSLLVEGKKTIEDLVDAVAALDAKVQSLIDA